MITAEVTDLATRNATRRWLQAAIEDPLRADIGLCAANGAFFLFVSLVPLTALLLSLLPYTGLSRQALLALLADWAPAAFRQLFSIVVSEVYTASPAALSLSAAAELWSAARFLASVTRGVAAVTGEGRPGALPSRVRAVAYTALLLLLILLDLGLLLFGERLSAAVGQRMPALGWALVRLRWLITLAALTTVNALLYRYAPRRRRSLRACLPGALLAAGGWLAFSRLFSWVIERFGLFGLYGSLAAVVVSLLWMYWSLYILFLGAWVSRSPMG